VLINVIVNGKAVSSDVPPGTRLVDLLRDQGLTGTKDACSRGECGACTVLLGGRPVLACLTLAALVDAEIETVEGLAESTAELRVSFADHGGLQCGYCTPGQIVTAAALIAGSGTDADTATVRRALDGNICRCTGSQPIADAIDDHLRMGNDGGDNRLRIPNAGR
jgi:aerobic-type carbon monoxide dehydrogenase small subunit (CoxS/CutS family)